MRRKSGRSCTLFFLILISDLNLDILTLGQYEISLIHQLLSHILLEISGTARNRINFHHPCLTDEPLETEVARPSCGILESEPGFKNPF